MAILRCKMCGGDLKIDSNSTVYECQYCGTKQTVPGMDGDRKIRLFDRANHLRASFEFDKASNVYENIVLEYPNEAEGYWGLILCKYGIEYVDDPTTGKKIPTCHRFSYGCVLDDPDYDMVMKYADSESREIYLSEAKTIESIRTSIASVSVKEEPYDIFICYKETDENGNRTLDSVMAQDIYEELTKHGYRIFFSRITLEDKLGMEYEPYIFSALNTAKLMLVIGTSYDNLNAVWVKNEWERYLQLMRKDNSRYLIPCYKDIDAYDMPKEFARYQSQDMNKIGAMQDLIRGVNKLIGKRNDADTAQVKTMKEMRNVEQEKTISNVGEFKKHLEIASDLLSRKSASAEEIKPNSNKPHKYLMIALGIIILLIVIINLSTTPPIGMEGNETYEEASGEKANGMEYDDHFLRNGSRYARESLTSAQKIWYDDMEHIVGSMEDGELSTEGIEEGLTEKDMELVFLCVYIDHPELFYLEGGYSYEKRTIGESVVGYGFSGDYIIDKDTALRREKEINEATKAFLEGLPNGGKNLDDYEKIKYVYEKLILETEYSQDAPDNQTIYSVLVGKKSVGQGYSKALQYMLNELGVECTLVQGELQGMPHGWHLVKADGEYYYVDVAWGDNAYNPKTGSMATPEIIYDYLLVTTEEITADMTIEEAIPLPMCIATDDNYFVREGAYFESLDLAGLQTLFTMATPENAWQVSVKCANKECFEDMKDYLLTQGKISDYYPVGVNHISYYQNEELHCLTFWVTN